jgi:iron-sulfur cluster assembly protein
MRRFIMLTVTENALTEIRNLTEQPQAPDGGGLRIATDPAEGSLTLALAVVPAEEDTVIDAEGVRLFLDAGATAALDDKTLDAVRDPDSGQLQFAVTEQPLG